MAQLNLADFSAKDRAFIEADIAASQYEAPKTTLGRGLALTAQGISDGVAGMVGLPSDLVAALLRKGGFDIGNDQFLGSESIKSALTYLGARPEIQARTTTERYVRRIAEEFGYAIPLAIPIFGMGARAARLAGVSKIARRPYTGTLKRTRELGRKMLTDPPLQRGVARVPATTMGGKLRQASTGYLERVGADPMGTLRREGLALTAAGAGAQTGRELYPDSLAAEITGQFLGPAGLMALKYVPTPLRIGKKVFNIGKDTAEKMLDENMEAALKQIDPTLIDPNLPGGKKTIAKWNAFKEMQAELGLDFDMAAYSSQDKRVQALFQSIPFTPDDIKAMQIRYNKNEETLELLKVYSNDRNFASQVDIVSDNVGPVAKGVRNRIVNKIEELEEVTTRKMLDVGVKPVSVRVFDDAVDASGYLKSRRVSTKKIKTPMKPLRRKSEEGRKIRSDFENIHDQDSMIMEETAEGLGLNTPIPLRKATQDRIIKVAQEYNEYMRYYNPVAALAPADLMDISHIKGLIEGDQGLKAIRSLFHDIGRRQSRLIPSLASGGENANAIMSLSNMKKSLEDLLSDVHRQIEGDLFLGKDFGTINPKLAKKMDKHGQRYVMKELKDSEGRLTGMEVDEKFPQKGLFWDLDTKTAQNPSLLERELAYREFFKKDYLDKWRTGIPLRMRKVNKQGFHIMPNERIATAYWGAGSGSGSGNIVQFLRVYPEGRPHLQAALMDDIWHNATIKMGTNKKGQSLRVLDPDRFEKWMSANNSRNYEKLLAMDIDPEKFLRDEIDVMLGLQQRMRVFKNRKEVINNNAMLKAFHSYGSIHSLQPVKEIIDAVKDPSGNKMRSVLSIVKGNEAALEGVKESVWNFAMKLDTPQMGGFLKDNKNALSLLFAPSEGKMVWTKSGYVYKGGIDHLERMERILSARIIHEGSYIPSASGSPDDRFKQFEQFMGQSFPSISNQVWTLYSRFLPARIVVARMISSLFRRMSTDKWNDALKDLFLNPESSNYMDKLVRASNPYGEKISSLRRLHLNWMLLGLEPMSKNTLSRENLQSELPIQDYNKYKKQAEILRKRIDAGDFRRLPSITKRSTEFSVGP